MNNTRLRKTFQYPTDDSDEDDAPQAMDEEEQEKLIQKLRNENDRWNQLYKRLFLAISITAALAFLPTLTRSSLFQTKLVCVLSISSICTSGYALMMIPSDRPQQDLRGFQGRSYSGPLTAHLVPLNGALSLCLSLGAMPMRFKQDVHEGFWLLCLLPISIFVLIEIVRRVISSTNVEELEKLRYGYKGA